jgi:hypothetical protein
MTITEKNHTVTVICMERGGNPDPLLYTVSVPNLSKAAITDAVREQRTLDLGDDATSRAWVKKLEPLVVLQGDPRQVADWRR